MKIHKVKAKAIEKEPQVSNGVLQAEIETLRIRLKVSEDSNKWLRERLEEKEEELESLKLSLGLANNRKYYRKFVDEVFRKEKGKELSTPDFDYIYELYFKQQAEIKYLEELYNERVNLCEEQDRQLAELSLVLCNYPYIVLLGNGAITTKNYEEYLKLISAISAEAVKEFADRLKKEADGYSFDGEHYEMVDVDDIDYIYKEMVGDFE